MNQSPPLVTSSPRISVDLRFQITIMVKCLHPHCDLVFFNFSVSFLITPVELNISFNLSIIFNTCSLLVSYIVHLLCSHLFSADTPDTPLIDIYNLSHYKNA